MAEELAALFVIERTIVALSRPHGVVARGQLIAVGISRNVIDNRLRAGWLRPMHRGVYAVGPIQSEHAPEAAAVLACGPEAVISHKSAAGVWQVVSRREAGPVEVTVSAHRCPSRRGILVHRSTALPRDQVMKRRRIPVTTLARTLLDVATQLSARELEQAVAQAERLYAGTQRRLVALLARYPTRPGSAKLRELLVGPAQPALVRSEAEERFLGLAIATPSKPIVDGTLISPRAESR